MIEDTLPCEGNAWKSCALLLLLLLLLLGDTQSAVRSCLRTCIWLLTSPVEEEARTREKEEARGREWGSALGGNTLGGNGDREFTEREEEKEGDDVVGEWFRLLLLLREGPGLRLWLIDSIPSAVSRVVRSHFVIRYLRWNVVSQGTCGWHSSVVSRLSRSGSRGHFRSKNFCHSHAEWISVAQRLHVSARLGIDPGESRKEKILVISTWGILEKPTAASTVVEGESAVAVAGATPSSLSSLIIMVSLHSGLLSTYYRCSASQALRRLMG
jgi:hypothetical protein